MNVLCSTINRGTIKLSDFLEFTCVTSAPTLLFMSHPCASIDLAARLVPYGLYVLREGFFMEPLRFPRLQIRDGCEHLLAIRAYRGGW